jgi:hypothetical protein
VYNSHTKKIETVDRLPYGKDSHIFYVFEDFVSHEGLEKYEAEFNQ